MKYYDAWEHFKGVLKQDVEASGAMMSMAEHTWTTEAARRYLDLIDWLEMEYE